MWSLARSMQCNDIMALPYITCKLEEAGSHATGIAQQQSSLQDVEGKAIHPQPEHRGGEGKKNLPQCNCLPPFPFESPNVVEDASQCPAPGVPTLIFNFTRRCDFFFLHLSKIPFKYLLFCLCFSLSISSLVLNSCRVCTTKCLCAGAEQWRMQTAGWPAGTSPALLLMNCSFSTLIAFNGSPHLGSHILLFNFLYFLWIVWHTKSIAKFPQITQNTLMTEE